jgi:hypothetical protein
VHIFYTINSYSKNGPFRSIELKFKCENKVGCIFHFTIKNVLKRYKKVKCVKISEKMNITNIKPVTGKNDDIKYPITTLLVQYVYM